MSLSKVEQDAIVRQIDDLRTYVLSLGTGPGPVTNPDDYPATEVPRIYDGFKSFVDQAIRDRKLVMEDYEMTGIQQGAGQIFAPRMTQAAQDKLAKDIETLARSDYGQAWFGQDVNAAICDRRYVYSIFGYWVRPKSNNPDDGLIRVHSAP